VSTAGAGDGDLCVVLHSHMPYVEGFGTWPFGEEWLLEAMAASYVPLVELLARRADRETEATVTLGLTPVLADQLELAQVGERFLAFMREVRRECHRLDAIGLKADGQHAAAGALHDCGLDYERAADRFEEMSGGLVGALRGLAEAERVALWTSAATHAVLPLVATGQGAALQLQTGIAAHRARFGSWGGGLWLPECGYRPGCEEALAAHGVRVFCVHQPAHGDALERLEPVLTPSGAIAVPIDWGSIELVWSDRGYPKDGAYRDYHRQTLNGMRAWSNDGRPYDAERAAARAGEHAREFVAAVAQRLQRFRSERGRRGLLVFAIDTELLGHWWYEGLQWLETVLDEAAQSGIGLATLPQALEHHDPVERPLVASTWGAGKDMRTWDSPEVAEYAGLQRAAELRLVSALGVGPIPASASPAAERAARELLALQSSDWAFIRTRGLASDYPDRRVNGHRAAFERAFGALERAMADFRPMSAPAATPDGDAAADGRLRGLAPHLRLGALSGPPGSWGRRPERLAAFAPVFDSREPVTV
jgi:1,4-alpha-glucan branching enzyme